MKSKLLTLVLGIFFINVTIAQDSLKAVDIDVKTVSIQNIKKSKKISELPFTFDTTIQVPEIKYSMLPKQYFVDYTTDTIKPVRLKVVNPLSQLYKLYIKLGFGMYLTPLADIQFTSLRSKNSSYGVRAYHLSSWQNVIKDAPDSKFMDNKLSLWGKKMYKNYKLNGTLDYDNKAYNFYGYESFLDTINTYRIPFQNVTHNIGLKGNFESFYPDSSKINFRVGLDYNYLLAQETVKEFDSIETPLINEHLVKVDFNTYRYLKGLLLNLDGYADYNIFSRSNSEISYLDELSLTGFKNNQFNIGLVPTAKFFGKKWHVKAGLGFYMSFANKTKFLAHPEAEFKYSFFDGVFIPYAGVTGGLERNNYTQLLRKNQFILSEVEFENTFTPIHIYGGFRGSISKRLTFNVAAAYQMINNFAFFTPDTLLSVGNRYSVQYAKLNKTTFTGELTYQLSEKLKLNGAANVYLYSVDGIDEAWYQPNFDLTLSGLYNLQNKLIFTLETYIVGHREVLSAEYSNEGVLEGLQERTLYPYLDINLGFKYLYSKRLSFFLNLNNIANQRYETYNRYTVQGTQVMAGMSYSFLK